MINDIGAHIPNSKKELNQHLKNEHIPVQPKEVSRSPKMVQLKTVWPEPDWRSWSNEGTPTSVLCAMYGIYKNLSLKPIDHNRLHINGQSVSIDMWTEAYQEVVLFIREFFDSARGYHDVNDFYHSIISAFDCTYPHESKYRYKRYAAGIYLKKRLHVPVCKSLKGEAFERTLPLVGWPQCARADKIPLLIYKVTKKQSQPYFVLAKIKQTSASWTLSFDDSKPNKFSSEQDAADALCRYHGVSFKINTAATIAQPVYIPVKNCDEVYLSELSRTSIDASTFMNEFGFRGVQFGNYVTQKERQNYIDQTYYALELLAQLLNIPHHWIGARKLGIAFGARGAGRASAHYEVDLEVINLTRHNGAGSIAHEMWHFIDARLAKRWFNRVGLLSSLMENERHVPWERLIPPVHARKFKAFCLLLKICMESPEYAGNAKSLQNQQGGRKYWGKSCEMFARVFESFVQDKLFTQGIQKQWLAFGTLESDYPANQMHPYPRGKEREMLNLAFERLLPVILDTSNTANLTKDVDNERISR